MCWAYSNEATSFFIRGEQGELVFLTRIAKINALYEKKIITKENFSTKLALVKQKAIDDEPLTETDYLLHECEAMLQGILIHQKEFDDEIGAGLFGDIKPGQMDGEILSTAAAL